MKASKITAADLELFHQAMRLVQPLAPNNKISLSKSAKNSEQLFQARRKNAQSANAALAFETNAFNTASENFYDSDAIEYLQAGYGRDLIRGLKRGKWQVQAQLDLHGYNLEQAQYELDRFLTHCTNSGLRCIRIIHGKGIGSAHGKAVLKHSIRHHLSRLKLIQAWVQAKPQDGGSGAIIALLKIQK